MEHISETIIGGILRDDADGNGTTDGTTEGAAPERKNPYFAFFGPITFRPIDKDKVYTNTDGSSSKQIARAVVTINGVNCAMVGNVYAKKSNPKAKPVVEFNFIGSRAQSSLEPLDERSKFELDQWKNYAAKEYRTWRETQATVPTHNRPGAVELDIEF